MDEEYTIRGFYRPSFFSIFINGTFDVNPEKVSKDDLGTFAHEYMHYLQNITTIFGLRNSIYYFNYLNYIKKHIYQNSSVKIPLKNIQLSQNLEKGKLFFSDYYGSSRENQIVYDSTKPSIEEIKESIKVVNLDLYSKGLKVDSVRLGSLHVKEGMASLFQSLYDPLAKNNHPTFPYKAVELLCEFIYPEILDDKKKLLSLCILSLNSQNSAYELYQLLTEVKSHPDLNGKELYNKFMNERTVSVIGNNITTKEFLLDSVKKFKQTLSSSLISELDHMDSVLENITISANKEVSPIIEMLYEFDSEKDLLSALVKYYGFPHIRDKFGTDYYPPKKESEEPSPEYQELVSQLIVFDRIVLGKKQCSNYVQCQLIDDDITDENCFDTQWKRESQCIFKIVSNYWKLNEKIKS